MSRLLSRSHLGHTASPLLTYIHGMFPTVPRAPAKKYFSRREGESWLEVEAGPTFVQGFLAGIWQGFQPLLLTGVAV